jgi:putative PIN family toxin of toxin-antitoxin system
MRAVLDTNVIVSALISSKGAPAALLDMWREGVFELVISDQMLEELQCVLAYPKVRRVLRYSDEQITELLALLRHDTLYIEAVAPIAELERDPADTMVLAAAVAADASIVVSGDADLLALERFQDVAIVPPAVFATWLQNAG